MWCAIREPWGILRLATVIAPIWLVILCTLTIYILAAKKIIQSRRDLKRFEFGLSLNSSEISCHRDRDHNGGELATHSGSRPSTHPNPIPASHADSRPERAYHSSRVPFTFLSKESAAFAYAKCAIMFFISAIVTWVSLTYGQPT